MLSYAELERAAAALEKRFHGAQLRRVIQSGNFELCLVFRTDTGDVPLLLSCHPELARICIPPSVPEPAETDVSFTEYVRAHMSKSVLVSVSLAAADRLLRAGLRNRDGSFELLLSILGARSNLYVLDGQRTLVHSMRPLGETRRELALGAPWQDPAGTIQSAGKDRWAELPDGDYLQALGEWYAGKEAAKEAQSLTSRIQSALGKEEAFLDRKLINLQEDLGAARASADYRRKGELLKTAMHAINPGDESVTVTDYQSREAVEIALDPTLSPAENLERYFQKYQKEFRGVSVIEAQLEATRQARSELDEMRRRLSAAADANPPDLAALNALAGHPRVRKLVTRPRKRPTAAPGRKREESAIPARLQPKRYRTEQGLEIWVGRNDEGNDYLTTRLAHGNDLFFHLEGYPGSHVVLRTGGRPDAPPEAVIDACELAVHFSKLKHAGRADVHVAAIKNVRKPKGAKPGLVYVLKGRTVHLRRDLKRLESVLAARIDE